MARPTFFQRVKHEKEPKGDLAAEVVATPGGEKIFSCLQCGTCGSACPVSVPHGLRASSGPQFARGSVPAIILSRPWRKRSWRCSSARAALCANEGERGPRSWLTHRFRAAACMVLHATASTRFRRSLASWVWSSANYRTGSAVYNLSVEELFHHAKR